MPGPPVVQLPSPTTSPWQDNPWYQKILRDTQNEWPAKIPRNTSSYFHSSPTVMSAFGAYRNPAFHDKLSASGNFLESQDNPLFWHDPWSTGVGISSG